MLHYFQSAYLSRYIVVFALALIYWVPTFIILPEFSQDFNSFIVLPVFRGKALLFFTALAFATSLLTALIANQIASDSGFIGRVSTVGLFVFVLFSSSLASFPNYSAFILINLMFVLFIRLLFLIPESNTQIFLSFNAALILGVSSLLFLPVVYLIVVLWIALVIHRAGNPRNYIASVIGLLTPFLFTFIWFFWFDRLDEFVFAFESLLLINPGYLLSFQVLNYTILFIIMILTLISTLRATAKLTEKNINQRRNLMIILYFLLFVTTVAVLFGSYETALLILCIPSALLVSHSLQETKKARPFNMVLITLIVLVLINHYLKLLI